MGCTASREATEAPRLKTKLKPIKTVIRISATTPGAHLAPRLSSDGGPPASVAQCIKALHAPRALGSKAENDARFQPIAELMRQTFQVGVAAVCLTGVDPQVFAAAAAGTGLAGASLPSALGSWVLSATEFASAVVAEDTLLNVRFASNEFVQGPPHLRFYAGTPLVASDGATYGMLCIADRQPRRFATDQLTILTNFAELAARALEGPREPAAALHIKGGEAAGGVLLCDMRTERWELRWANRAFEELAGVSLEAARGADVWSLLRVEGDREEVMAECDAAIFCQSSFTLGITAAPGDGADGSAGRAGRRLQLRFTPASRGLPSAIAASGVPPVDIPVFLRPSGADAARDPSPSEHLFWGHVVEAPAGGSTDASGSIAAFRGAAVLVGDTADRSSGPASRAPDSSASSPDSRSGAAAVAPRAAALRVEPSRPSFGLSTCSQGKMSTWRFTVPAALSDKAAVFDQVTLGPLLGAGSYGRVYRGHWRGTEVAVKVISDYYCEPFGGSAFELTAEKHSALLEALLGREFSRHPNLAQTYDLALRPAHPIDPAAPSQGPVRHTLWIISELFNRGTLYDAVLKGRFRHSPPGGPNMLSVLLTAQEIAGGMSLLHDAGILHSDLTPNNVLLKAAANSRRFTVAVSDFGLSRMCCDADGRRTATVGTVTHQPPELLREGLLTPAVDVYAYGVLLWMLYTSEHPFQGDQPAQVVYKVVSAERCPLVLPPGAPAELQELFERCVSYDRSARPSFHQILKTLAPMVARAEAEAPPPSPRVGSPDRRSRFAAEASVSFKLCADEEGPLAT